MESLERILSRAKEAELAQEHGKAIELFTLGIALAETTAETSATLYNDRAWSRMMEGKDRGAALSDNQTALKLARESETKAREQQARALIDSAYLQRVHLNDVPLARQSLQEAAGIAPKGSYYYAKALDQEGRTYLAEKDHERMIPLFTEAVKIYTNLSSKEPEKRDLNRGLGDTTHLLGLGHLYASNLDEAKTCEERALEIQQRIDNPNGIYNAAAILGTIAFQREKYDEAIAHFQTAKEALGPSPNTRSLGVISLHRSEAYLAAGKLDEAKTDLDSFVNCALSQTGIPAFDRSVISDQFQNVARMYRSSGLKVERFEEAERLFIK